MAKRSRAFPRPCLRFAPWLPAPAGSAVLRGKGKGLPARPSKDNPCHSQERKGGQGQKAGHGISPGVSSQGGWAGSILPLPPRMSAGVHPGKGHPGQGLGQVKLLWSWRDYLQPTRPPCSLHIRLPCPGRGGRHRDSSPSHSSPLSPPAPSSMGRGYFRCCCPACLQATLDLRPQLALRFCGGPESRDWTRLFDCFMAIVK